MMTVPNVSDTNNKSDTHDLVYNSLDRSGVPKGQQCQFLFELLFLALAGGGGGGDKNQNTSMSRQHASEAWKLLWELSCHGL